MNVTFNHHICISYFHKSPYSPGGLEDSVSIGSVGRKKGSSGEFKQKEKKTDTDETNNLQVLKGSHPSAI